MLFIIKLDDKAMLSTCSHSGEDLGFDVFELEDASARAVLFSAQLLRQ